MVTYPDLSNLTDTFSNPDIGNFLTFPNSSFPFFWAWILGGIWLIMTLTLYFKEKERIGRSNILSSMAVSCFAIMLLAVIGSVVGFITLEVMIPLLVFCFLIIGIWFFSNNN